MRIQSITNQPKLNFKSVSNDSATKKDVALETVKEISDKKEVQKSKNTSKAVIAALTLVVMAVMSSRGFQKNSNKYLKKFRNFLEGRLENSSLKESSKLTKFYQYSIRQMNSFIRKSESINNITSLKDILFMKLMYKSKPTKKIHKSISDYFEKVSQKTVNDSYEKTKKSFKKMNEVFDKLDEFILKDSPDELVEYEPNKFLTKRQLIKKAREHRDNAQILVDSFISKESLENRYKYMNEVTSNLYSSFWDASFKDFWSKDNKFKNKDMWQKFIAAEQIQGNKTEMSRWAATARNAITYTKSDKTDLIYDYVKKLDGIVPSYDKEGIEIIKKLEWFSRHSEGLIDNKSLFLKELAKLKKHIIPSELSGDIEQTITKCRESYIETIEELVNETGTGELQDMLSIYYKIAPFELANSGASLAVQRAVVSFDKSVNLEVEEFFDKLRDLKLGSAPTDILTILFSFVALSFGLGYAKDKDERISRMFKSGIPIVGGIATTMFTTTKLVSGGKSLALGFLSGIVLNQIGKIVDNIRIKNRKLDTNNAE